MAKVPDSRYEIDLGSNMGSAESYLEDSTPLTQFVGGAQLGAVNRRVSEGFDSPHLCFIKQRR